jgi:hypothetical protein
MDALLATRNDLKRFLSVRNRPELTWSSGVKICLRWWGVQDSNL